MYDRILVPTDGSDVSEVAIEHAVDLAEKYDAEVHALYVVDVDAVSFGLGAEQVDRIRQGHLGEMEEVEQKANDATGAVADAAAERGIDVAEAVRVGQPHAVVADYAEDEDIDLVVIGSHGRSGVRRALLGSVTERVLRSTRKPVLVVDFEPED
ncbi:universal stress protein [Salarchaeum sp. JOR-1]|uniref:universal stress protein n=1 Tax=Salarchaeum sp. JOR-1 TaxID=2599399 RepID=UPI001198887F|nr:universal stress protein [Salarchaeum sp. JOR-1]QDX40435.1 universal stress protein [Salarchaeum sp. JOR-1]